MGAQITLSLHDQYMLGRRIAQAPEVVGRILNKVLLNIAIDMERTVKMTTVPVLTGRLQSSVLTERQQMRYTITPNTEYAVPVHNRNPYMDNAFDIVEPGARQELNDAVQEIIKSI